jgi:hypothetical protein
MDEITSTFWIFWALAFLAFPIGGLAAAALAGPVTDTRRGAFAGAITGTVLGLVQWLVLKGLFPLPATWILVTALGMAFGLGVSVWWFGSDMNNDLLIWRAAFTGLCIGIGQWLVLRQTLPNSEAWMLVVPLAWVSGWFITRRIGVDLQPKWSVFGAAGAIMFQVITGLTLYVLL